jgi:hypothetical protein
MEEALLVYATDYADRMCTRSGEVRGPFSDVPATALEEERAKGSIA